MLKYFILTGVIFFLGCIGESETAGADDIVDADDLLLNPQTISLSEVEIHNIEGDCWTHIRGKVYDVTSFVEAHPGGADNIKKLCGVDGTDFFVNKHGGNPKQETTLEKYYIGELS